MNTPSPERIVKYVRHEFHGDEEPCEGPLVHFVYDIPYFGACGVFPPLHIINQTFSSGGGDGGMSPGASWDPFTITADEYQRLVASVRSTPLDQIRPYARYANLEFLFDSRFDHVQEGFLWLTEVCSEHRTEYQRRTKEDYDRNAS